jgi:hypothetical protein
MAKLDLYEEFRQEIQSGDCLLWRSHSAVGSLIRMFTGGFVNHAGLAVKPSEHEIFKNRRFTLEAVGKGVVFRLISEQLRDFDGGKVWLYQLKDEYDFARDHVTAWGLEKEGTPYDYGSLFKQAIARVSGDMRKFWCSEFCYFGWKKNGIPIISGDRVPYPSEIPDLKIFKEEPRLIFDWES